MYHLVAIPDGVEYFVEHHDVALMSTADYVAAARAASLEVSVERDYLPDRDRIIGTRSRADSSLRRAKASPARHLASKVRSNP
jgi:hypothetical protein